VQPALTYLLYRGFVNRSFYPKLLRFIWFPKMVFFCKIFCSPDAFSVTEPTASEHVSR